MMGTEHTLGQGRNRVGTLGCQGTENSFSHFVWTVVLKVAIAFIHTLGFLNPAVALTLTRSGSRGLGCPCVLIGQVCVWRVRTQWPGTEALHRFGICFPAHCLVPRWLLEPFKSQSPHLSDGLIIVPPSRFSYSTPSCHLHTV